MNWRDRIFGAGLVSNIGANGFSLLVQVFIQLASVPILAHSWGLETYGVWLILLTIPAWLGSGDLGFQGVAANEMTAQVARGERAEALATFHSLATLTAIVVVVLLAIGVLLVAGPLAHLLSFADGASGGHATTVALLMLGYGLLNLVNGLANAALRATGAYSKYTHAIAAAILAENIAVIAVALSGGGLLNAVIAYASLRAVATVLLWLVVRGHARWLLSGPWHASLARLKGMARPAAALAIMPLSFTLSIQSMAPVIAAASSVAMVPLFTSVRTLTRFAVQVTAIVSNAIMPNFTVAVAQRDTARQADLAALAVVTSAVALIPAFVGLALLGPWFMETWTGGAIDPPYWLILALAGAMLANGTWLPLSNLLIAVNRHESFTYVFLALSACALGLAYLLVREMGVTGAGVAVLMLELCMLGWIVRQVRRQDMLAGSSLRAAPGRTLAMMRARFDLR